jgi:hypothetical protein
MVTELFPEVALYASTLQFVQFVHEYLKEM